MTPGEDGLHPCSGCGLELDADDDGRWCEECTPEVLASVHRSPLHRRTWVPMLSETEVWDSVYAGPLRVTLDAARDRVEAALRDRVECALRWRQVDADTWHLEVQP